MNFREALDYAKQNYKELLESKSSILGVGYTPDDFEAHFWIVDISLNEDDLEDGNIWFDVLLSGGHIPGNGSGIEDSIGGSTKEELMDKLPNFVKDLNYKVFTGIGMPNDLDSEYGLKVLFPDLPSPDEFDLSHFKSEAIKAIKEANIDLRH